MTLLSQAKSGYQGGNTSSVLFFSEANRIGWVSFSVSVIAKISLIQSVLRDSLLIKVDRMVCPVFQ